MMARHVVANTSEIEAGGRKLVDVAGRMIVVFNIGGEFFALANRCPHKGGELCKGKISGFVSSPEPGVYNYTHQGEVIRCPWHGWEFHIRTGKSWCDPRTMNARAYDVTVEKGSALLEEAYIAETFTVLVEDDYLIIDV
jgi:3-phenylpropionate/trans-cinnamate dioxygenase ferredoxin subunit